MQVITSAGTKVSYRITLHLDVSLRAIPAAELPFIQRVNGRADLLAPVAVYPGVERLLFGALSNKSGLLLFKHADPPAHAGTDHPFFPPLEGDSSARWPSVDENLDAIAGVPGWGKQERDRVLGQNAVELFGLEA